MQLQPIPMPIKNKFFKMYSIFYFFWEEKEEQSTIMFFHPWSPEQLFGTTALEIQKTSQNP